MILAPVPRVEWRAVAARVGQGATLAQRVVKPAAPNLIAQRRPFEILQKLRLPREMLQSKALGPADAEWQRLARLNNLWFVRRRHLAYRDDLAGSYREIAGNDERVIELNLNTRITQLGLTPRYDAVLKVATPAAASTVIGLLAGKRYLESPVLTAAALGLLTDAIATTEQLTGKPSLDKTQVLGVAAVLGEPEKNEALWALIQRESKTPIPADELLRIASNAEWNVQPVDPVALEEIRHQTHGRPGPDRCVGRGVQELVGQGPGRRGATAGEQTLRGLAGADRRCAGPAARTRAARRFAQGPGAGDRGGQQPAGADRQRRAQQVPANRTAAAAGRRHACASW